MKKNLKVGDVITRDEALELAPDYVKHVEGDWAAFSPMFDKFNNLKRGQLCITYDFRGLDDGNPTHYRVVKVTSADHNSFHAVDGPVIRVGDNKESWRVDGASYAAKI